MRRLANATFRGSRGVAGSVVPSGTAAGPPPVNGAVGSPMKSLETVTVHFVDANGVGPPKRTSVQAPIGASIVDVAKPLGIDIHAACGQKLQCATCHVILQKPFYDLLQPPGVREGDLLDSTFTLTPTSRLGCQVRLTPELDGIECTLPDKREKGSVRMSMEQARPKIETQWTDVPAVPLPPSRSVSRPTSPGPASLGPASPGLQVPNEDFHRTMRQQLEDQRNLTARLESELRQLREKGLRADSGKEGSNTSSKEGEGDEKDDLSKVKAELERCRVDLSKSTRKCGFEDVIGLDNAKQTLREAVIWPAVADASLFCGIRGSPRGLLLYGPPGCGKTMLARAAASELEERATFFHVRPADVMSKFYGESQRRILALEELATESAPSVIFFDEVDSLLGGRDGSNVAEHHRATTNALLAWMDGFGTGSENVFFLGATNRAEAIDEAALRRFGEAVEVELPCVEARLGLLSHLCCDKAAADGHLTDMSSPDLEDVAARTDGYSLADVDRLVRRAFLQVIRDIPGGMRAGLRPEDVPPVKLSHFVAAMQESTGTSALRAMLKKRGKERAQL